MRAGEFEEFKNQREIGPSEALTRAVFSRVHADLHPSGWRVFSKLALIHLFVGLFTLSLCPQFGVHLFGYGIGLMMYFSRLGDYGCMTACGFIFMSLTAFAAALLLNRDELRGLKKNPYLQIGALSLLSLGLLLMFDAQILMGFALAWLLGTLLGGRVFLGLGCYTRESLTGC